jgi:uncharacterized DUF497 family protein
MQFEYDPAKGTANEQKHGVDFVEARRRCGTVTIKRGILLQLEQRADQLGVSRDALLETWLREKLEERRSSAAE